MTREEYNAKMKDLIKRFNLAKPEELEALNAEKDLLLAERSKIVEAENLQKLILPSEDKDLRSKIILPKTVENSKDKKEERNADPRSTVEYRSAFRDYVINGTQSELLKRADSITNTTNLGAIIPTTIMTEVIKKMKLLGDVYARLRKTNILGGVEYPIDATNLVATWVAEGSVSDKQNGDLSASVSFKYHKLQCKVATTLLALTVSLDMFEGEMATAIAEAMIIAVEDSVFNGTGTGQPLGVLNDTRILAGQKVEFDSATDANWAGWKSKLFTKIPAAYRKGPNRGVILCSYGTWDALIDGMTDTTGQPIARVTTGINAEEAYRFNGYEVIPVTYLPDYDTATASEPFLVYMNLNQYALNSNLQIAYKTYMDEDLDQQIQKATMICDGKILNAEHVVILTKPAA